MIELDKKYVLHIPLTKYADGKLMKLDLDELLDELIDDLNRNGIDGFYITHVESHYKSRSYDEKIITVFASLEGVVETIFRDWFLKNNDVLGQEAFAYEFNDVMYIEDLDDS